MGASFSWVTLDSILFLSYVGHDTSVRHTEGFWRSMLPKALARHLEPFVAKILFAAYNLGRHYHPQPVPFRVRARSGDTERCFPDGGHRPISSIA